MFNNGENPKPGGAGMPVGQSSSSSQGLAGSGKDVQCYRSPASRLICVFGDQGSGKTCLIPTAPVGWKVHLADIDGGFEAAWQLWQQAHNPADITWATVNSFRELHAALWNPPPGYNLYIIDTYTIAMQRFKKHVISAMNIAPEALVDWRKIGGSISTMAIDYFDQWREQVAKQDAWGLVLCQEKTEGDDDPKVVPALVGQARAHVAGTVNELLHLEKRIKIEKGTRTWERVLRTKDTGSVLAKDRSMALDEYEPADLAHIINKIEAHRTKGDAK